MRREIIIGDIHGCDLELEELLLKVSFDRTKDQLYFTGDLINRGPNSLRVLEIMEENYAKGVKGNHEMNFLECLKFPELLKEKKGMKEIKEQLGDKLNFWKSWLENLPYYLETENFILVHAGLPPESHFKETPDHVLCTIRTWDGVGHNLNDFSNPPWHDHYHNKKLVIYGHWASQGLLQKENSLCLDSGCVYGGHLSAFVLPEKKITQVKAHKIYTHF